MDAGHKAIYISHLDTRGGGGASVIIVFLSSSSLVACARSGRTVLYSGGGFLTASGVSS